LRSENRAKKILVLGATGILGLPVTQSLLNKGQRVRVLARDKDGARRICGNRVEIFEGSALKKTDIQSALEGCEGVHISLPLESELAAIRHVIDHAAGCNVERITYVSATTAFEENQWFDMIDEKIRCEKLLKQSGIAYTIFCPTWAMETLHNFVKSKKAIIIVSPNPASIHFFAAADFGRIVAESYEDNRALGKRLFIHGPEPITLPDAFDRFIAVCHPGIRVLRIKLWQARFLSKFVGSLSYITRLISYFDRVGEMGDPTEANTLLGAPSVSLEEWLEKG
jgi:uncharacterized protein YbjT (DUF2867 family)